MQDSNNALIEDISSNNFSIIAPLLLISPNGGEVWEGGTTQQITWVYSGTSNYFNIDYSLDAGNTWQSIGQSVYNTNGIYSWVVPNTPSTSALVRVTDYYESCQSDKSDFTFEILPATPVINVTYPYIGVTMFAGRTVNVSWNSQFVISNQVQIEYTTDGGTTWNYISTITENEGSYTWLVPNEVSNQVQVRITDLTNNQTVGYSGAYSSIALPFINITAPTGGSVQAQCELVNITWTSGGTINNRYRLEWSDDGGASWNTITSNYFSTDGSYAWTLPNVNSSNLLVRVQDHTSPLFTDESNSVFTIIGPEANAGTDVALCAGESALLQATGGVSYLWSPSTGLSDTGVANPIVSVSMSTVYTVTTTDANGCVASDDVLVSIDNGLCDIEGCMDTDTYNYNPLATIDNGFCLYTEGGGGGTCATDIDGDGIISTSDLLLVLGSFGSTCE